MRVVQSRVDSPCAGVPVPRVSNRAVLCKAAQTDLPIPVTEEASGCPVSAVKNLFKNSKSKPLSKERQEEHDRAPMAPGPPALSLESALDVSQILRFGIHEAMLRFNNKYGDVCRFANPASLNDKSGWIFVNDPDVVQHCSSTNVGNYQLRFLPDIYTWVTHGQGILGSQGDYNAKHRRLCSPMFRTTKLLRQFSHIITDRAVEMTDSLVAAAKSRGSLDTDISLHTQRLTLDIVGLTAFSYNFQQIEQTQRELKDPSAQPKEDKILWAVNTFGETLASVFITPLPVLKFLDKLGFKELKQLSKSVDIMRDSMLEMIHVRRSAMERGEKTPDDLLGTLLSSVDPEDGTSLTDEELWEDVHDVMGAGHETTGTTTAAVLYCVSTNPEVEEKLIAELREVCGDRPPTFDDLENLVYLEQVVKEVLRLYPAIPMFPREASTDDILPTGHRVDAGDVVFMSTYTLGRSDRIWDEPMKFDPERFSPGNVKKHHKFQFLPFGAGARMCVGATWAEMSVSMMAATLLQKLKFTAVSPTVQPIPVDYDITMNFNPTNGLHMSCVARD